MSGYKFKVFRGSPSGDIVESVTERPALNGDQVYLKISHSGVCGSDEHFVRFGIALGHEGIGTVEETGPSVKALKVGDRVGWGYVSNVCGMCAGCLSGNIFLCEDADSYGRGSFDSGSFATGAIRSESFLFRIPDAISSAAAAPLMCAGVTVFAPLVFHDIKPYDVVGIVGIGGLGHLAIQFAKAMGCMVIAFSQTDSKKEHALALGASEFISTQGKTELVVPKMLNHLIVTTSQMPDWELYFPILVPGATIFPQVATDFETKLTIPHMKFLLHGIKIISALPTKKSYSDMLEFAARHNIKPIIDRDSLTKKGIETSMQKLRQGQTRYRGVLYAETEE